MWYRLAIACVAMLRLWYLRYLTYCARHHAAIERRAALARALYEGRIHEIRLEDVRKGKVLVRARFGVSVRRSRAHHAS